MACYGEEKALNPVTFPVLKKTMEIIGVYSPLGRCLKTSFALALGQILAKDKAVLYLNLEEYSGFEELLGKKFPTNLSDLFYYVRQGNENLIHRMNGMIQTVNNLDFIPPVRMPSDIRTLYLLCGCLQISVRYAGKTGNGFCRRLLCTAPMKC